jgi:hypothetical protein
MNRSELIKMHEQITTECRQIMEAKNRDYAGGKDDPFSNFKAATVLGIEPEMGLLLRCMDKFKRIQAFVNTGTLAVKEEPVDDAIKDVINYMVLLKGLIEDRKAALPAAVSE